MPMVSIKRKMLGGRAYYYLEHAFRKDGRVRKTELYLGKTIPKNIEDVKRNFLGKLYREKWYPLLDSIKREFSKERLEMPQSALEKETETFAVRFTYDTQRMEGSTLSLRETAGLLEKGISPKGRPIRDVKEAEAHKGIFEEMLVYKKDLSLQAILWWHKNLFRETRTDIAGKIRQHQVAISGSRFVPPSPVEVHPLLTEFFRWYEKNKKRLHPVELAALVHLKFVTIHPFADGNGRISRLMMNFVLNRNGYPMLNIPYENRNSYYNALERAQAKNVEDIFLQWFMRNYVKSDKLKATK